VTCDYISYYLSQPNWVESVEQLYQSIFIHPSLEYIGIKDKSKTSLLKNILQKQKKILIDKRKQQQLLKPTPTIELLLD
jgi:sacsin